MLCDMLKIPYTELQKQPRWFVKDYPAYMEGKNKAEKALSDKKTGSIKKA